MPTSHSYPSYPFVSVCLSVGLSDVRPSIKIHLRKCWYKLVCIKVCMYISLRMLATWLRLLLFGDDDDKDYRQLLSQLN